jgi:hypothetical protein
MIKNPSNPSEAICKYKEKLDPQWENWNKKDKHPLLEIMENDFIYPPTNFVNGLMYAWLAWRSNELTNEQVEEEIAIFANWVNLISENKPSTRFWRNKFYG